jgi:tetratricopeptide (TPR) repeat protein
MSRPIVTCPACRMLLTSDRPVPAGATLRCPGCRARFQPAGPPAPTRLFGGTFVVAVAIALLLGGAIIIATVLVSGPRPAPAVAQPEPEPEAKPDEGLQQLEALRAEINRQKRLLARADAALAKQELVGPVQEGEPESPALAEEKPAAPKEPEKTPRDDFKRHMEAGRAALDAGRLADAVREYAAAVRLMPDDLEAQQGAQQAEAKLAGLADKQKRQAAFDDLMERAQQAVSARRFKDALAAAEPALRLFPDDREALRLLRSAKEDLKHARAANAKLLARADEAARLGKADEAGRLVEQAAKNWPEDDRAERARKAASRLAAAAAAETPQAAYLRSTQQGTLAMAGGRYAEAVTAYAEALRLAPLDIDVQRNLRVARAALERDLRTRVDYERLYRAGHVALVRQSFGEAARHFSDALKLVPGDLPAAEALAKARYAGALVEGQQALRMRRKAEAVAAFEAALAERPGDVVAGAGLRQARMLR